MLEPEAYALQLVSRAFTYPLAAITRFGAENNLVEVCWNGARLACTLIVVSVSVTWSEVNSRNNVEGIRTHPLATQIALESTPRCAIE